MNNITKKIVVDSSVFLKTLFDEQDSQQAIDFFTQIAEKNFTILVPDLFVHEVYANCATKKLEYQKAHLALEKSKKSFFKIINLTDIITCDAFEMTKHGNIKSGFPSFYDCIYHSLAIQEKCTFITADEKHFAKTHKKFGHIKLLKNT